MKPTFRDVIFAIGTLMCFASLLFKDDLFPQKNPHGHWFWIGVVGGLLSMTSLLLKQFSKAQQRIVPPR